MMEVRERLYDIDDLWRLVCESADDRRYELIEGEIIEMAPVGEEHGSIAGEIYFYLRQFDPRREIGIPSVETGFYAPGQRHTLLGPDVAFRVTDLDDKAPLETWVPKMPDLAVEVKSPRDSLAELRRKAALYLQNGARLVWIVMPETQSAEVWRLGTAGELESQAIGSDGSLSGEDILPGFALPLAKLFDI